MVNEKERADLDSFSVPELLEETVTEETTLGVIDKIKGTKKARTKSDVGKSALFIKWFEKYLNDIYQSFYTERGSLRIVKGHEGGFVNLDMEQITLYEKLIEDLWASGVPPLLVFYHEVGHVLYTTKDILIYGKSMTVNNFTLLNWIEDFYIEDKLMKELYFIKPYIRMLHEVVPDFIDDWQRPEFALHYYYSYEGLTPKWMEKTDPPINKRFTRYIQQLKHLRTSFSNKFSQEKFIRLFEEFYSFCIHYKIINKDTAKPPLEPDTRKKTSAKGISRKGTSEGEGGTTPGGSYTGSDKKKEDSETAKKTKGTAGMEDKGEDVPESIIIRPPYKPLDIKKGFTSLFDELAGMIDKAFDKALYDSFKLKKTGKPRLVPVTIATASPRSMIDPVAIATNAHKIYLEYTLESFEYTAYNLFIDVSGSVGYNRNFNQLGKDIINIISQYPHAVYGYGDDVTKWDQKKIDNILSLRCRDSTESPLIGEVILEKKELGNLNIILSDGDLNNLVRRKDIAKITEQYLFVFVVSTFTGLWKAYAAKYFNKNQVFLLSNSAELPKGLEHLKQYIKAKGL